LNKGFNTFRAFAFLAVFLFHIAGLKFGYIGVQAFFVLSSFLLTPILFEMKKTLNKRNFFLRFYLRRALRIFPLYYFYLFVVLFLLYLLIYKYNYLNIIKFDNYLQQLPWAATYTYNFFLATNYPLHTNLVSHFWSLAVEEQFYLIWPLIIYFIPKRYFKNFLFLIIILCPILRLLLSIIVQANLISVLYGDNILVVYVLPISYLDAFAIGGFFSLYNKAIENYKILLFVIITIFIGFFSSWIFTGNAEYSSLGYLPYMKNSYQYIWGYTIMNFLFGLILLSINNRKFFPKIFENSILSYLGKISYGLYIYHFAIILFFNPKFDFMPIYFRIPTLLLITILISILSFELFEKHFLILKDKYFAKYADTKIIVKSKI
jgi:peptidoglycan/LPS O-acetylase OafA/YrhL